MRRQIRILAGATFREAIRDRVLFIIVIFAAALVLFSRVLGWLSVEDELKMVQDFSLTGLSLMNLFLAMLVGAFSLAREMERRTAYSLLTRDLTRAEFIIGKFAGLVAVVWLSLLGSSVLLCGWLLLWGGQIDASLLAAIAGLACEAAVLMAVALFLGSLSNPTIAAAGTFVFYWVGHSAEALRRTDGGEPVAPFRVALHCGLQTDPQS